MRDNIVNGVNIAISPSYPADGLCPECKEPFWRVEVSQDLGIAEGDKGFLYAVEPVPTEGPYFVPCKHDARCCFPKAAP